MVKWLLASWLSLALFACVEETVPRTQLMLVVDTDIQDLERVELSIAGNERDKETFSSAVREDKQPISLALLHEGGPLGPVLVSAAGFRGEDKIVERAAIVAFVQQKTLVVPLHLLHTCETRPCESSQTCTENGCESLFTPFEKLSPWSGTLPTLAVNTQEMDSAVADAAVEDASTPIVEDGGLPEDASVDAETADGSTALDAAPQNDGAVRVCGDAGSVDTTIDENNCGECANVCMSSLANTAPVCEESSCASVCRSGYADCDKNASNGCEIYLSGDPKHCGMCGRKCGPGQICFIGVCLKPN